jgi:SAM-dependent methyltransferase
MKKILTSSAWGKKVLWLFERIVFGGRFTEVVLLKLLGMHYRSLFRRDWAWSPEQPHFFSHRVGFFDFVYGDSGGSVFPYYRGFFVSELIRDGDLLLDIGCGDGFFTKRFYSRRCEHIDAIDIEPTAIAAAMSQNASSKIRYQLSDAVNSPFPSNRYNVVVWDGAIGHFAASTTHVMLAKIADVLATDGVFAGSESLGFEGHDHLQFFESVKDMDLIFSKHFAYRAYRVIEYDTPFSPGMIRREAYWRCSGTPLRVNTVGWTVFEE